MQRMTGGLAGGADLPMPLETDVMKGARDPRLSVDAYIDRAIARSRFVENPVISDETFPHFPLGRISDDMAEWIVAVGGPDLSGYEHVLRDNDLRHIYNRHGPHTNENYPVTIEDLKSIPEMIDHPDVVYYADKGGGRRGLYYQKRHNGTTFYLEAIQDDDKRLIDKQMIKVPTGTIPDFADLKDAMKNNRSISPVPGDAANAVPQLYVPDVRSDASIISIPPDSKNIKPQTIQPQPPGTWRPAGNLVGSGKTEPPKPFGYESLKPVLPDGSTGASPAGFDPYSHMQNAFGTLKPGEQPHGLELPKPAGYDVLQSAHIPKSEAIRVGRATTIQKPYTGKVPRKLASNSVSISVPSERVEAAQRAIDAAQQTGKYRANLKKVLQSIFDAVGGQRKVTIDKIDFDGRPYDVSLNRNIAAKVASDPHMTPEKLAVFEDLDQLIKTSEYVGSGRYGKAAGKGQNVFRYDYFESPVEIAGNPYIMTFDVAVYRDTNNFRTYRMINEIDLTPTAATHRS